MFNNPYKPRYKEWLEAHGSLAGYWLGPVLIAVGVAYGGVPEYQRATSLSGPALVESYKKICHFDALPEEPCVTENVAAQKAWKNQTAHRWLGGGLALTGIFILVAARSGRKKCRQIEQENPEWIYVPDVPSRAPY